MQDSANEGIGYLAGSLISGIIAAASPHPAVKLIASLVVVGATAKAGECFQATARESYYQLRAPQRYRQLRPGY